MLAGAGAARGKAAGTGAAWLAALLAGCTAACGLSDAVSRGAAGVEADAGAVGGFTIASGSGAGALALSAGLPWGRSWYATSAAASSAAFNSTKPIRRLRVADCFSSWAQASGMVRVAARARAMRLRISVWSTPSPYRPGNTKASRANTAASPHCTGSDHCSRLRPMPKTSRPSPSAAATYTSAGPQRWRSAIQFRVQRLAAQFQPGGVRPSVSKCLNRGR